MMTDIRENIEKDNFAQWAEEKLQKYEIFKK